MPSWVRINSGFTPSGVRATARLNFATLKTDAKHASCAHVWNEIVFVVGEFGLLWRSGNNRSWLAKSFWGEP